MERKFSGYYKKKRRFAALFKCLWVKLKSVKHTFCKRKINL